MLLYPVYAVLFAETGLSAAEISSLFAIWSVTAFVVEVPSGVLADRFSRRWLLAAAPAFAGAGFALWTLFPSYASFAVGFVLWGAGTAMRSGALQALVYAELERVGATGAYARLVGRSETLGIVGELVATAAAAPVMAAGGYRAVGLASVLVSLLASLVGWRLPEVRARPEEGEGEDEAGFGELLRGGLAEVRQGRAVRRLVVLAAVVAGIGALDEYLPLLAGETGAGDAGAILLVLLVTAGSALGGWFAGRGTRWTAAGVLAGAGCLAAGAVSGHPAGMVLVAAAYGVFQWAAAAVDARLQERVPERARATITSVAGFGAELVAVLTFAGYAFGSTFAGAGPLFALAAVPYLLIGLALGRAR